MFVVKYTKNKDLFLMSLNDLPRIVNVPTIKLIKSGALSGREGDLTESLTWYR